MADILSYQGNAGLGIGGNGSVPVVSNPDRDQIGQAIRDVSLQDNQWNIMRYQQKQKEQAELRQDIENGSKAAGYILPEYQPMYDRAQKRVTDYFQQYGNEIISDPKKYQIYRGLVKDAQERSAHAQTNTLSIEALQKEKANAILPSDRERIQKHIDEQLKVTSSKFDSLVAPLQKIHNMSIDAVMKVPAAKKASFTNPNDPFGSYDTDTVDYNDILRFKQNQFLNDKTGDDAESLSQFYDKIQSYDPVALGKTLSSMDNQLARYNKERGFKKGDDGYVNPINREIVGGQLVIKEPKVDFAAKAALANQPAFVTRTNKFNDKVGSYLVAKEKANTAAVSARLLAADRSQRTRLYGENIKSQIASRTKPEDQAQFMDEMYDRNLLNQDNLVEPVSKLIPGSRGEIEFSDIQADNSLPVFTLNGKNVEKLIPIGATQKIENKKTVYVGGHYEPQYLLQGKKLSPQNLGKLYADYKKTEKGKEFTGTVNDFIKSAIQNKAIDFLIKGQNGVVDRKLSIATQRAISNQNTSKGETPIFDSEPPPDDSIYDPNPIDP